jgi:hypothetical protein
MAIRPTTPEWVIPPWLCGDDGTANPRNPRGILSGNDVTDAVDVDDDARFLFCELFVIMSTTKTLEAVWVR